MPTPIADATRPSANAVELTSDDLKNRDAWRIGERDYGLPSLA